MRDPRGKLMSKHRTVVTCLWFLFALAILASAIGSVAVGKVEIGIARGFLSYGIFNLGLIEWDGRGLTK